jgi:hypothetical protein
MNQSERAAQLEQTGLSGDLAKRLAEIESLQVQADRDLARLTAENAAPGNTKEPTTFYGEALKRASLLPDSELRKHAEVSAMEGAERCHDCFCCACWSVLFERERTKDNAERLRRQAEFEVRYQKIQAKKEADRQRMHLE